MTGYAEIDVLCPSCGAKVRVDIQVEQRRMTFGGKEQGIIEVSSGYEAHECDS